MYEDDARAVAQELVGGDYTAVRSRLPADLAAGPELSENVLRSTMLRTIEAVGEFREIGNPEVFTTVAVLMTFERGKATLRVSFDKQRRLVGLVLTPSWG